jgi:hypothetical protein
MKTGLFPVKSAGMVFAKIIPDRIDAERVSSFPRRGNKFGMTRVILSLSQDLNHSQGTQAVMYRSGLFILLALLCAPLYSGAADTGSFRTVPVDIPSPGMLRASNSSYYSEIDINPVLKNTYGVQNPRVLSSITDLQLGIFRHLALTGSLPYFADLFNQSGKKGHKSGAGDISAGLRTAFVNSEGTFEGISFGAKFLIPEELTYGNEPLGFRTFSSGNFGYSIEAAGKIRNSFLEGYASAALFSFRNSAQTSVVDPGDVFYDTGFGYRGIGKANAAGYAENVFQNQVQWSLCGIIPFRKGISGIMELDGAMFTGLPKRESIFRVIPGLRLGSGDGMNISAGFDIGLKGPVPKATYLLRINVPSLSPRDLGKSMGLIKKTVPEEQIRAKNIPVAVHAFTKSIPSYLYEQDLRDNLMENLSAQGIMHVVPGRKVDEALHQESFIAVKDTPQKRGIRLGADFIIYTNISSYTVSRTSRFSIPFLILLPSTDFTLSTQASVADLSTGEMHELGIISATVSKPRDTIFFPMGASSDLTYLSEPEMRILERELINRWVARFNTVLQENLNIFDWGPKRAKNEISADTGG